MGNLHAQRVLKAAMIEHEYELGVCLNASAKLFVNDALRGALLMGQSHQQPKRNTCRMCNIRHLHTHTFTHIAIQLCPPVLQLLQIYVFAVTTEHVQWVSFAQILKNMQKLSIN